MAEPNVRRWGTGSREPRERHVQVDNLHPLTTCPHCLGTGSRSPRYTKASAVSAGAGPYFNGAIVKLARPWLTLRTAAE
jgi:hypothetical protein